MYPVKVKDLIPEYAVDKGLNPEHLESMMMFQYEYTRNLMESMEHPRVGITGLGIFPFKIWKVKPEDLTVYRRMIRMKPEDSISRINMVLRLKKLRKMRNMILEENERKQALREKKSRGEHIPSIQEYVNGCRCDGCRKVKSIANKKDLKVRNNRKKDHKRLKQLGVI